MADIVKFIESLGGLHDSTLIDLVWQASEHRFEFSVEDMYWDWEGTPEYPGPTKGRFIFTDVGRLDVHEVFFREVGLMIYDWTFSSENAEGFACEILFSPGGKILIDCGNIELIKV